MKRHNPYVTAPFLKSLARAKEAVQTVNDAIVKAKKAGKLYTYITIHHFMVVERELYELGYTMLMDGGMIKVEWKNVK